MKSKDPRTLLGENNLKNIFYVTLMKIESRKTNNVERIRRKPNWTESRAAVGTAQKENREVLKGKLTWEHIASMFPSPFQHQR